MTIQSVDNIKYCQLLLGFADVITLHRGKIPDLEKEERQWGSALLTF